MVSAKDGLNVGAEKSWKYLCEANKPRAIYISKLEEENADFDKAFDSLREKFGNTVCPVTAPIREGEKIVGIVDIIAKKAYILEGGKRKEIPVPGSMSARVEELYGSLSESVAETSEELMEKYFEGEAFTTDEIYGALGAGIAGADICPVFCGSGYTGLGTLILLDAIVNLFPPPTKAAMRFARKAPPARSSTRPFPTSTASSPCLKSFRVRSRRT